VAGRATGGREVVLEAREQVERAEGDRRVQAGAVERIGDKLRETGGDCRLGCCGGLSGQENKWVINLAYILAVSSWP
jgi:hypothetical protein